jgi:transcriptional regulator with XRE-family HTH domain
MTQATPLSFQDIVPKTSPAPMEEFPPSLWGYSADGEIKKTMAWKQTLAATLMSSILVGTGGIANANTIPWLSGDSSTYRVSSANQPRHRPSLLLDTRERMAALRRYLSLNITDLAKVLRVERPTIYAWLQGSSAPHPGNLKRLEKMYRLSRDWRALSAVPVGRYAHEPFENGRSLLDYLSAEGLDELAIRHAFASIKSQLAQDKATSMTRRRNILEVAQLHGFAPVPDSIQKKNFDEETAL